MIDFETAKKIALEEINRRYTGAFGPLVLLEADTIEKPYGWIFFYVTQKYSETQEFQYALAGNGPLIVERLGGAVHRLGTGRSVEEYVREFELRRGFDSLVPKTR